MKFLKLPCNEQLIERLIKFIALLIVIYATYLALRYSGQPILELFGFRQTQTALTSFWFLKEGFKLAYETPIAGAPWTLPFEFPIYQAIVALIAKVPGTDIAQIGRIVSFIFLVLCLVPARAICRSLNLPPKTFYMFTGLLFTSPLYVFWGRTFMIETLAVFLAVAAIKYFIDFLQAPRGKYAVLFTALISLSILQKATTGLPVLAVMAFVFLFHEMNKNASFFKVLTPKNIAWCALLFAVPLALGVAWTHYTDTIKLHNEFGTSLTSAALTSWNWGSLPQRLSEKLYVEVIWRRILQGNLSGIFGIAIIAYALLLERSSNVRLTVLTACVLAILPLYLFTNLHMIHTYYQSANVIFLIFALAVALGGNGQEDIRFKSLTLVLFVALVVNNHITFRADYKNSLNQKIDKSNSRDLLVADALKHNLREGEAFTLFGNDWSSSITYYSEHKSFAVPNHFKNIDSVISNPQQYMGDSPLGAVVVCPEAPKPTLAQLLDTHQHETPWKTAEVSTCYISVPQKPIDLSLPKAEVQCAGSLDSAGPTTQPIPGIIEVKGWTVVDVDKNLIPTQIYITLKDAKGQVSYYDALQYAHPGVNDFFKKPNLGNTGFGRVIDTRALSGAYTVGVARVWDNQLQTCQFAKEIQVNTP